MTRRMTVLVAGAAVAALGLTACSGGSGQRHGSRWCQQRGQCQEGHLHQAGGGGVLQGPHRGVLEAFADKYKTKTGTKLDVQIVSWDAIDQQSSTMIQNDNAPGHPQPQRLRQLRQGPAALQRRRRALARGQERPAGRLRQERHLPGQDVRHAGPVVGAGPVLQQGHIRARPDRGPAEDLGRVRGRRQEAPGARWRQHRLRDAARPGGGPGRVLDLDLQQRRRLEIRRQVDDQLAQERRDAAPS